MSNEIEDSGKKVLDESSIKEGLKKILGWDFYDSKLSKKFEFSSFRSLIDFVIKLTPIFDAYNHHAEMFISYKQIVFSLQTKDVGGQITNFDFIIARKINEVYKQHSDSIPDSIR